MFVHELNLINFRATKKANLLFQEGINLITGTNGQGKSHLLQSIAFLTLNHSIGTFADYCNWDSSSYSAQALIDHLGHTLLITNRFNDGKLERELKIDDADVYIGSDATAKLAEFFDPVLCKAAMISFQGEVDLVSSNPAQKRDSLKKIYTLDYAKGIKKIDEEIKNITENELSKLKSIITLLEGKKYLFREITPVDMTGINEKRTRLNYIKSQTASIQKEVEEYDKKKKQIDDLNTKKKNIEGTLSTIDSFMNSIKSKIDSLEKELLSISFDKVEKLQATFDANDWELPLIELQNKIDLITLDRIPPFDSTDLLNSRIRLQDEKVKLARKTTEIENAKSGKCPTCERPYEAHDAEALEKEVNHLKLSVTNCENKVIDEEQKQKKYQDQVNENNIRIEKKANLETQLKEKRLSLANQKNSALREIELEKKMVEEKKASTTSSVQSQKELLFSKQKERDDKYMQFGETELSYVELSGSLPEKRPETDQIIQQEISSLLDITTKVDTLIAQNALCETINTDLKKERETDQLTIQATYEKINIIQTVINKKEKAKVILQREFPNFVINQMGASIESGMNYLVDKVYKGKYHVQIEETKSGIDFTYGKKKQSVRLASGFEIDLFNAGYKHAFSQIAGLDIIILDEIDRYADQKNSEKFFEVIGGLKDNYKQIFIVTHKSYIQEVLIRDYQAKAFMVDNGEVQEV